MTRGKCRIYHCCMVNIQMLATIAHQSTTWMVTHYWQTLGSDLFEVDISTYLLVSNVYSKMWFMWKFPSSRTSTNPVIARLKELFAKHWIPMSCALTTDPSMLQLLWACHQQFLPSFFEWIWWVNGEDCREGKYSIEDPSVGPLGTPINTSQCQLPSPAQLLY